jgi:hypothetical protein
MKVHSARSRTVSSVASRGLFSDSQSLNALKQFSTRHGVQAHILKTLKRHMVARLAVIP